MLDARTRRFCEEYVVDSNAVRSYRTAGFAAENADVNAYRLFHNFEVQVEIERLRIERSKRTEIKSKRVLEEIARLAFSDPRRVYDESGRLLPVQEWPDDVAAAIKSIKRKEIYEGTGRNRVYVGDMVEVQFWDKPKNLELLGRHLSMFVDRVQHTGKDDGPIHVANEPATDFLARTIAKLNDAAK